MNKSELRALYMSKRRELSPDAAAEFSVQIADRVFARFDISAIESLHCYLPIAKLIEVDTSHIFRRVWAEFPSVCTYAPRIDPATGELEHPRYSSETDLQVNRWGVPEPVGSEKAEPGEIDLVLVPLLCFDERGYRVGYGKGYYDIFLASCRPDCRKVGLSFFPPAVAIGDVHAGDVALDECITPSENFIF